MTAITSDDATTARQEPRQARGIRACPPCTAFAEIAISVTCSRLDGIGGPAGGDHRSRRGASVRAAALLSKDGAR